MFSKCCLLSSFVIAGRLLFCTPCHLGRVHFPIPTKHLPSYLFCVAVYNCIICVHDGLRADLCLFFFVIDLKCFFLVVYWFI